MLNPCVVFRAGHFLCLSNIGPAKFANGTAMSFFNQLSKTEPTHVK